MNLVEDGEVEDGGGGARCTVVHGVSKNQTQFSG